MYHGEKFNSITHLVGAALAIAGGSVLITRASIYGDVWAVVSTSIYSTVMVLMYIFSTLYHSLQGTPKIVFRKLDHIFIYLLIAGTYTPFCLIALRDSGGWWLFGIVWGLALLGIVLEFTVAKYTRLPSLVIYVVMGWLILGAMDSLTAVLPQMGLFWLALGGLFYTGGIVFYVWDEKVTHFHGVWHLFVMAGSISQYFCILLYLVNTIDN